MASCRRLTHAQTDTCTNNAEYIICHRCCRDAPAHVSGPSVRRDPSSPAHVLCVRHPICSGALPHVLHGLVGIGIPHPEFSCEFLWLVRNLTQMFRTVRNQKK